MLRDSTLFSAKPLNQYNCPGNGAVVTCITSNLCRTVAGKRSGSDMYLEQNHEKAY